MGEGVSKCVTKHFVIKAIITLGEHDICRQSPLLANPDTLRCKKKGAKSFLYPVLSFKLPPSLAVCPQHGLGPYKAAGTHDCLKEMTSSRSNSDLHSTVCSTVIILPCHSFPASSGHLNPLIIYQQRFEAVFTVRVRCT